ncbi:hypothetical protein SAMN05421813_103119 [Daejeonella rubra]|uniref:Auto-transporter adhesin head GIN domain-containing protein n=1 Tax=Daejeonella rubra TaxID=990371 RepID=A0A1G9NNR8_9SPHI|nr:hypothetical protein [Daejeonella rubra]SDL88238.1 hypothetical protein SAMN05421813_103119 [Daejeonella rubra]
MKNSFYRILFFALLLIPFASMKAQDKAMLIAQIEGKKITRESFDNKGKLTGKQIFTAGKMTKRGESFFINIKSELYDEAQKLEETYTTSYECHAGEADVLLSVFAINPKKRKVRVSVKSGDFKKLYALTANDMIRSMSLTMYVESGILNFLGSKNNVDITNRVLTKENNNLKITEKISIKAYLMGLRVRTINYNVTEYLTLSGSLQKQVFRQTTGDYFTVTYK